MNKDQRSYAKLKEDKCFEDITYNDLLQTEEWKDKRKEIDTKAYFAQKNRRRIY